jgi:hypothetical protein
MPVKWPPYEIDAYGMDVEESLRRVVKFMACGQVYGVWSGL